MNPAIACSAFKFGSDVPKERLSLAVPMVRLGRAVIHNGLKYSLEGTFAAGGTNVVVVDFNPPADKAASLTSVMTDTDANILYTFKTIGVRGNDYKIVHHDPSGNNKALAVTMSGTTVTISLATGVGGAITSTAAQVVAAFNLSDAAEFITASLVSTGGVVNAVASANLSSGASAVYIHLTVAEVGAAADIVTVDVIEDATYTGSAATFTPYNRNRNSANTSKAAVAGSLAATVTTTTAVFLDHMVSRGAAAGVNVVIDTDEEDNIMELCPGKKTMVRYTPTGATAIDYKIHWTEWTDC